MTDASPFTLTLRCLLAAAAVAVLSLPAWWVTGRLPELRAAPSFRTLVSAGGALVAYLTVVNLAGRAFQSSTHPATAWIVINAVVVGAVLAQKHVRAGA